MRLFRKGRFADDSWVHIDDEAPLPIAGRAVVSLKRWRDEQPGLVATGVPVGVRVVAGENIDASADNIARLGVIAVAFAKFTDGRGYSIARALREQHGYSGELRATGEVLLDQLPLMIRCGFDAFEITHAPTIAALERGHLPAIAEVYQPWRQQARRRDARLVAVAR